MLEVEEFIEAKPLLEEWVGKIDDPAVTFAQIDADGSGSITFDEFCDWSINKNLDLDGKDDLDLLALAQHTNET